jgi:hypothetical protein
MKGPVKGGTCTKRFFGGVVPTTEGPAAARIDYQSPYQYCIFLIREGKWAERVRGRYNLEP